VLGSKIDKVLRRSECDLLITKIISDVFNPKSIFLAVEPTGQSPQLKFIGKIINAVAHYFNSKVIVGSFVKIERGFKCTEPDFLKIFQKLKFLPELKVETFSLPSISIIKSILKEGQKSDLIVLGATRKKLLRLLTVGNIAEAVIKHSSKPVFIIKGYKSITLTLLEYLKERFY